MRKHKPNPLRSLQPFFFGATPLVHGRFRRPVIARLSYEDNAWETMAPVGRECGSPDYERLTQQDELEFRLRLAELVSAGQAAALGQSEPEDPDERTAAHNVQAALRDWGQDVSLLVAAFVWHEHWVGNSLLQGKFKTW